MEDLDQILMDKSSIMESYGKLISNIVKEEWKHYKVFNFLKTETLLPKFLNNYSKINLFVQAGSHTNNSYLEGVFYRYRQGSTRYNDFTLRTSTVLGNESELQKITRAVKRQGLYPKFCMVVYCDDENKLTDFCICHTVSLVKYLWNDIDLFRVKARDNPFICIGFQAMKDYDPKGTILYSI